MSELNVAAGCEVARSGPAPRWYNWPRFPLVPQLETRQEDRHNTWRFHFHWLFFRAWTSDAPMFGASFEIETYGANVRMNLPYLWVGLFLPFPMRLEMWSHRNLWRKTTWQRESERREQSTKQSPLRGEE